MFRILNTKTLGLALSALMLSTAAAANPSDQAPSPIERPALVDTLTKGGLTVAASFDAGSDMKGWVLSAGPGQNLAMYTTPDGQRALVGNMFDANGVNLTTQHMEKYAPKIDYEKRFADVEKSAYVIEGQTDPKKVKRIIYAFKDANCGYCHQMWNTVQPYVAEGLQVRWIPVAFLAADSANKGAAMLQAPNAGELLKQLHGEWGNRSSTLSKTEVTLDSRKKMDANKILMDSLGIRGTPALLYRDIEKKVQFIDGAPSPADMPAIAGFSLKKDAAK